MEKNFLLTDEDGENIVIITTKDKGSPAEFNSSLEQVICDHYSADFVIVERFEDDLEFTAKVYTNGDEFIWKFSLEELIIY